MDTIEALTTRSTAKTYGDMAPTRDHLDDDPAGRGARARSRPAAALAVHADRRRRSARSSATCSRPSALRRTPALSAGDLQRERDKAMRAPLIILVACRAVTGTKVPVIEQILAAGAAAQNILLGLHNFGYAAAWKTGDAAYDPEVKKGARPRGRRPHRRVHLRRRRTRRVVRARQAREPCRTPCWTFRPEQAASHAARLYCTFSAGGERLDAERLVDLARRIRHSRP